MTAIEVRNLRKSYGDVAALRGIDFDVEEGDVVAILGPNGAGKSTTIEILEGYKRRDGGTVSVLGTDPATGDPAFRARIGIVLQECAADPYLSVREVLEMYGECYPRPQDPMHLLELVELADRATSRVNQLSGGQKRRLDVALALVGDPDLLFLDEPTTGLDPHARRRTWEVIDGLRTLGTTIVLTTHYLDEAQHLADRLIVVAGGRIVAEGLPSTIGGRATLDAEIRVQPSEHVDAAALPLIAHPEPSGALVIRTKNPTDDMFSLLSWARERGIDLEGLTLSRPSLEDVYLALVAEHDVAATATDAEAAR